MVVGASEFAATYRQVAPMIYAKALRMLGRTEDAADALQEVAIKLSSHYAEYLASEQRVAWIYRVTTNTCLNLLRTRKRKDVGNWSDPDLQPSGGQNGAQSREDSLVTARDLQRVLGQLPEKLHAYFVYLYIDGMTQEEIAVVTGQARITVARGLKKLSEILRGLYATP